MKKCHFIKILIWISFVELLLINSIRSIEIKRDMKMKKLIEMKKDFLLIDI